MDTKNTLKQRKIYYWIIGVIVVVIAIFIVLRNRTAAAGDSTAETTGTVVSMTVSSAVEASGSLAAQPSATLTWSTGGVVEEVCVKAGDQVKEGDVLMELKTASVSSSIISAQADLITAQQDLDTLMISSDTDLAQAVIDLRDAQKTYDKAVDYLHYVQTYQRIPQTGTTAVTRTKANSWMYIYKTKTFRGPAPEEWIIEAENDLALKKAELDSAQHTYDRLKDGPNAQDVIAAQAQVDAAQATVDSMKIIAPFDGQVLYIETQPGEVVSSGSEALDLANLGHLYIETQVDESNIASVNVGDPVTATLDAIEGLSLTGTVVAVDPVGQENSGVVKYTAIIDLDKIEADVFLPLQATVNVVIQAEPPTAVLAAPAGLVQSDSQGEYVMVIQSDGSAKRVDVETGAIEGDLVIVTGNLKEGETLTSITDGGN